MKMLICALIAIAACHTGINWAVLVAGSDGYSNYRHQSNVFHAYQMITQFGIPKDKIIVLAKDDIAYHKSNPFPGKMFNTPTGANVYEGVIIDYKGKDVTPQNYLNVIKGEKKKMKGIGSGRVLESTSDDNVFLFYSDHGNDGIVSFPGGKLLYADQLQQALKDMHAKKMYNHLIYYLDACYSGSMLKNLPTNLNIYATTSANPKESSYGTYCGNESVVNGTRIGSCLGGEYSISFCTSSELHCEEGQTLGEEYEFIKGMVKKSHPSEYGDLKMKELLVSEFHHGPTKSEVLPTKREEPLPQAELIASKDIYIRYLKYQAEMSNLEKDYNALYEEIRLTARSKLIFDLFNKEFNLPLIRESDEVDYRCLRTNIKIFEDLCGRNERDLEFLGAFTIACSLDVIPSPLRVYSSLKAICLRFITNTILNYNEKQQINI